MLEERGLDEHLALSAVGAGLGLALQAGCRHLAAGDLQLGADGAEHVAQVVSVRLRALGALNRADVAHVGRQDLWQGRARGQGVVVAADLGRLELALLFLGELE